MIYTNLKILSKIFLCTVILLFCGSCGREEVLVQKQHIIYDSNNTEDGTYALRLRTILTFNNINSIERKDFNDFYTILNKDTIPLIPVSNRNEISKRNDSINVEYISYLFFNEKKFDNPALSGAIKNSYVKKYSDNKIIFKAKSYSLKPKITINSLKPIGDAIK
ncbi:hypothetical protein CMT56_07145 [Elizabethkingia anophelis]|uniref:hypothetical protein n=1 Tax=Elizabethkingia anophelis TaxID=1117645 RepID=UPI000994AFBE|nr:hypothetical protein [Elizabethkingia anophelis]AQW93236.1 hypothetical protein BBD30_03045 [Elizabethkingia anophelis]MDV3856375.1 hypothetical protein [Elizabethkingia anophelis]MDV3863417.1 hypothetical protein [Elizabethkingia anophelis]MDV3910170.1 hypothetical protein [Elizabethkingia anophelis]MDV3923029.1 hypothetical protein [Elizabethkingia anophelis]